MLFICLSISASKFIIIKYNILKTFFVAIYHLIFKIINDFFLYFLINVYYFHLIIKNNLNNDLKIMIFYKLK